eukprot:1159608-Pelagomonas_calceolata.AAC.5
MSTWLFQTVRNSEPGPVWALVAVNSAQPVKRGMLPPHRFRLQKIPGNGINNESTGILASEI